GEITSVACTNSEKSKLLYSTFFPPQHASAAVHGNTENPPSAWQFTNISDDVVAWAIDRINPDKATHSDSAPDHVIKECKDILTPYLGSLFQATFTFECYPEDWACMETLVLCKPGKPDYSTPSAWRPIVLSHGFAHLLNSCMADELTVMSEHCHLLPSHHF
ncbi:hypothetical protein BDQ17DRAFT_1173799, partial [Cyathus striatus]